jgi:hypothetical protein
MPSGCCLRRLDVHLPAHLQAATWTTAPASAPPNGCMDDGAWSLSALAAPGGWARWGGRRYGNVHALQRRRMHGHRHAQRVLLRIPSTCSIRSELGHVDCCVGPAECSAEHEPCKHHAKNVHGGSSMVFCLKRLMYALHTWWTSKCHNLHDWHLHSVCCRRGGHVQTGAAWWPLATRATHKLLGMGRCAACCSDLLTS